MVGKDLDYLVLDLDKTTHLERNLGELLLWELAAHEAYGESATERSGRRWFGQRMLLDWSRPTRTVRYLASAARRWARAGIHYLVWGKLASRSPGLQRLAYRRFGPSPTVAVQRRPQMVALTHLATADEALVLKLARRVWNRHAPDQVVCRDDLNWVRERSPGVEIILCSASPKSMLEVAAEELVADRTSYSTAERINSGRAKIEKLREICPRVFDPDVNVVGITDTSYGEDHCWAEHFACVVDINSPTPFPPIVAASSPVREVHSAIVLTREEQRRRNNGDPGYLDARRQDGSPRKRVELDREALRARLGGLVAEVDRLPSRLPPFSRRWEAEYARTRLAQASRALLTTASHRSSLLRSQEWSTPGRSG